MNARELLAAATPRPWFVVGLPWNQAEPWINAESEDPHGGRYVCEFNSDSIADMDEENLAADAALIVAAVNEYEALLDIEDHVRTLFGGWGGHSESRRLLARLDAIRTPELSPDNAKDHPDSPQERPDGPDTKGL